MAGEGRRSERGRFCPRTTSALHGRRCWLPPGKPVATGFSERRGRYDEEEWRRGGQHRPYGDFTRDSGHRLLRQALDEGLAFTAVAAAAGMVAAGALTALHEAGLDVPGDASPAGYDDIPFARDLYPA
ncbi:substrate-binding domain-containing protein [Streptomyces bobili]|uniref:substrate-binding domain-containing protein n=1 Tax=Streptomyces bobili TaxID=67280 RepID=UPI0036FB0CF7